MSDLLKKSKLQLRIFAALAVVSIIVLIAGIVGTCNYTMNGEIVMGLTNDGGYGIEFGKYHGTQNVFLDFLSENAFGLVFNGLLFTSVGLGACFLIVRILKNPSKLREISIEQKDERTRMIRLKSESLTYKVLSLFIAVMVMGIVMVNMLAKNPIRDIPINILSLLVVGAMWLRIGTEWYLQKKM